MKTVEVELPGEAEELDGRPGIAYAHRPVLRTSKVEPALAAIFRPGLPYEWQYVATRVNEVPEEILRAASTVKIAVIDTGADVTHPDLAAKNPETWDVVHRRTNVVDRDGHGTFVSALAAGSVTNGDGIAGFGGDAQLLMIKAVGAEWHLQRRRRGGRHRLRGRPRREDHQPQHRRRRNLPARDEGDRVRRKPQRLARRRSGERVRGRQPGRIPGRRTPACRLQGPGRLRPRRCRQHDVRQARVLLQHGHPDLARRAGRQRLRRRRRRILARILAALPAPRLQLGPLRLVERHVVLHAGGRRGRCARLGREPRPDGPAGRGDPQGDRLRAREVEP